MRETPLANTGNAEYAAVTPAVRLSMPLSHPQSDPQYAPVTTTVMLSVPLSRLQLHSIRPCHYHSNPLYALSGFHDRSYTEYAPITPTVTLGVPPSRHSNPENALCGCHDRSMAECALCLTCKTANLQAFSRASRTDPVMPFMKDLTFYSCADMSLNVFAGTSAGSTAACTALAMCFLKPFRYSPAAPVVMTTWWACETIQYLCDRTQHITQHYNIHHYKCLLIPLHTTHLPHGQSY